MHARTPSHRRSPPLRRAAAAALACVLVAAADHLARAQAIDEFDRERGRTMLNVVKNDIKKNYYDPAFRGIDLEARFKAAEEQIGKATSNGEIFAIIAQALIGFDDSHLFFVPPARAARVDYGWRMHAVGDTCYVLAVKPGSDAEAKGLRAGDAVLRVDGYTPTRKDLWKIEYLYNVLRPQAGVRLMVQSPDGAPRQLEVAAKVTQTRRLENLTDTNDLSRLLREIEAEDYLGRHRWVEAGKDLLIWRTPRFDLSEQEVDRMKARAAERKALILDLRENGGGAEETMLRLIGSLFDRDVKVGDLVGRKEQKPVVAKTRGERAFKGTLVVLVDSRSGSASEVLARVVQLEKRGTVIGDRTAGAVMRSMYKGHQMGTSTVVFYGTSVTINDLVMTDGKSLERVGVTPDEVVLPTGGDLAAGRDVALARAADLCGVALDAEKAGTLFPREWRK